MDALLEQAPTHEVEMCPDALAEIDMLDLSKIKAKLQHTKGWDHERCEAAEMQYRHFMKLAVLEPGEEISPLGDIDEMWHTHILFTKKYTDDCQHIFGHYMHHFPLFAESQQERSRQGRAKTRQLFLKHFGECTKLIDSCACGNSGGNCCGNDS